MAENEILAEIHRTRETIARESEFDVAKLFAHFREVTAKLEADGWRVAPPEKRAAKEETAEATVSGVLREDPPRRE